MAKSVLELAVGTGQWDAGLKKAKQALDNFTQAQGGIQKALAEDNEKMAKFVEMMGDMSSTSTSTKGQLREMSQVLTDLTSTYRNLSDEEKSSPFGKSLAKSIESLTARAGDVQDAMSDVQASIHNAASDTRVFDQVSGGIQLMTNSFQTAQGAARLLGIELGDNVEVLAKLQAAMAVTSGLREVQALLQKQSALMMGINALQMRFNVLAKVNPYVLLAGAVTAVAAAFALFTSGADDAAKAQEELNKEIENSLWQLDEIKKNADFDIAIAEAAGKSWEEIHSLRIEAAKLQEELAFQNMQKSIGAGKDVYDKAVRAFEEASDNYSKVIQDGIIHYVREKNKKPTGGGRAGGTSTQAELVPQYSIAGLTEDLKYLQQEQQKATNPEEWRTYADAIRAVEDEIRKVKGELSSMGLANTAGISISGTLSEQVRKDQTAFKNQKLNVSPVERQGQVVSVGQTLGSLAGGMNQIAGGIEQLGIDIPEGFNKAIGVMQAVAAILTGISTVVTIIAAIQGTKAVPIIGWALARGGVVKAAGGYQVPGNNYSNDMVPALLNSGELVLNKAQQGNLAAQLSGGQGGYAAQPYVNGEMILLGTNNYLGRSGQGEVVTTKMLKSMGLMK